MANNYKRYMTPEVKVVNIVTAPLLSGSSVSGANATWVKGVTSDDVEDGEE